MTSGISLAEATAALTAPGQLFEMEEADVLGVRMRVWKATPPSLRTVLDMSLAYGDTEFLVYEDRRISYADHYRMAATLAQRLRDELGVKKGDRVAIAMRNLPEWVVSFWAASAIGAIVVPLNAWWTGPELAFGLADSGSAVAVVDTERAGRIGPERTGLPDLRTVVVAGAGANPTGESSAASLADLSWDELVGTAVSDAVPPDVAIAPDDDATIFYTSGTTGRPRGAVGTHRNACTNLMNLFFVQSRSQLRFGTGIDGSNGEEATRRCYLLSVPLFHATGCLAVLVTNTAAGSKLVLMHHFDPELALELIERERVTIFGGVPTVVMRVLDSPDLARRDLSSVRQVSYGGAPAPPELVRRIRRTFALGQPGNGYGLTETSAATAINSGEDYVKKPDSVGPAVPVADVAIVPLDLHGVEPPSVPAGTVGELWVKGPHVVRGYWNRPEETAQTITAGWLHTGDLGRVDEEGFIFIVDRAKDIVIRGGENVYSVEVEDVLFSHPAVADCAVIGVPHPVLGEEVGAVVVLRPGHKVTADELAGHVHTRMAQFNVPTRIWFRSRPLPRNPAGKVAKRALRYEVLGLMQEGEGASADSTAQAATWGGTDAWEEAYRLAHPPAQVTDRPPGADPEPDGPRPGPPPDGSPPGAT